VSFWSWSTEANSTDGGRTRHSVSRLPVSCLLRAHIEYRAFKKRSLLWSVLIVWLSQLHSAFLFSFAAFGTVFFVFCFCRGSDSWVQLEKDKRFFALKIYHESSICGITCTLENTYVLVSGILRKNTSLGGLKSISGLCLVFFWGGGWDLFLDWEQSMDRNCSVLPRSNSIIRLLQKSGILAVWTRMLFYKNTTFPDQLLRVYQSDNSTAGRLDSLREVDNKLNMHF